MFAFPELRLSKRREGSMPGLFWALGFLGFPFQLGLQGGWGSRRGWGAKSHCIGLQQWLALSGPDIRRVIVKPMLIAQEKAAFKSISMLNWVCVYDMARIPHYWTHLCPPSLPFTSGWAGPWWDNWIAALKQIGLGVHWAEWRCCMQDIKLGCTHHSLC